MNKRRLRFNAIDVIIILVLAAAVYVVLNIFVFGDSGNETSAVNYKTIQYVVEVNNIDERFKDSVKVGQSVQDAVEKKSIGNVVGVQATQYRKSGFDYGEQKEVVAPVENRISIKITIEAEAVDTEYAYTVNGREIRVGQLYSLILPDMYAAGYCISMSDDTQ